MQKKPWPLDTRTVSNLIVVLVGILFYFLLYRFGEVREKISMVAGVLSPFIVGFAIAYLLNTPTTFFEEKCFLIICCAVAGSWVMFTGLSLSANTFTWNATRQTNATTAVWMILFIILRFLGLLIMFSVFCHASRAVIVCRRFAVVSDAKVGCVSEKNLKKRETCRYLTDFKK